MKKPQSTVLTLITVICGFYLWELLDSSIVQTLALPNFEYLRYTNEWYRLFTVALLDTEVGEGRYPNNLSDFIEEGALWPPMP